MDTRETSYNVLQVFKAVREIIKGKKVVAREIDS